MELQTTSFYYFRSYKNLMVEENMTSNRDGGNDSDDFM